MLTSLFIICIYPDFYIRIITFDYFNYDFFHSGLISEVDYIVFLLCFHVFGKISLLLIVNFLLVALRSFLYWFSSTAATFALNWVNFGFLTNKKNLTVCLCDILTVGMNLYGSEHGTKSRGTIKMIEPIIFGPLDYWSWLYCWLVVQCFMAYQPL